MPSTHTRIAGLRAHERTSRTNAVIGAMSRRGLITLPGQSREGTAIVGPIEMGGILG